MKMRRIPTYSGKIDKKDEPDILYWAFEKTARERLLESRRLHCVDHGIEPYHCKINKKIAKAFKRS